MVLWLWVVMVTDTFYKLAVDCQINPGLAPLSTAVSEFGPRWRRVHGGTIGVSSPHFKYLAIIQTYIYH